jgi:RHS repeat-associated protein
VDIVGIAPASASVTVNSSPADYRRGEYFQELVTVANGANPVWQAINVTTSGGGSASGNVFVARTPEDFDDPATPSVNEGYDLDGNQLRDGRWNYTWDAENRLTKLESLANAPSGSKRRLEFEYDWQGRRIKKKVTNLETSTVLQDNKFLYDGWNLVAELNATNNALIRCYMWGLDLSGSMQGAGGVGGLLAVNDTANGVHFAAYDGNGNVTALVKAADGTISAQYEYGPFAEPIRVTGPMGKTNPIRFSTKYTDDESDFLYYGHRYYNPSTGRWLNRDPIGERGGLNVYCFVNNRPINAFDAHGLWLSREHHEITDAALNNARPATTAKCKTRIYTILMRGNMRQDMPVVGYAGEHSRHYTRKAGTEPDVAIAEYVEYVQGEEKRFGFILQSPTKRNCYASLMTLGRLMHTWQDFYGHSVLEPKEPKGLPPDFNAWSNDKGGTPESRGDLVPAAWADPTEHHFIGEPVDPKSDEGRKRKDAAIVFASTKMAELLPQWLKACRCRCETADWFYIGVGDVHHGAEDLIGR